MSETELKPCPFCGAPASREASVQSARLHVLACANQSCRARFVGRTWVGLARRWNRRAPATALQCPECAAKRLRLAEPHQGQRAVECLNCGWEWDEPA